MSRNRSRSPLRNPAQFREKSKSDDLDVLHLQNIPRDWHHSDVKDFLIKVAAVPKHILNAISYIRILKDESGMPKGECLVIIPNSNLCKTTCTQLTGVCFDGNEIFVTLDKESSFPPRRERQNKKAKVPKNVNTAPKANFQAAPDVNNPSLYETYGLSTSFLTSLGIKPPLLSTIFIANLDAKVEEGKLREVFSHAGRVLSVMLIKKNPSQTLAKVEFDHPVEAVQAISMFHNQELYNRKMVVQIDKSPRPNRPLLPEGLSGMGPGLGENGEPLRGVRNAIELQPFKQFLTQEVERLKNNDKKEDIPNNDAPSMNMPMPLNMPFSNLTPNMNISSNNLMTSLSSLLNTQGMQNYQALQNLLQQNIGNDLLSFAAFSQNTGQNMNANLGQNMTQNMGQNMTGFNPNMGGNQPQQISRIQNNQMSKIESAVKPDNFSDNRNKYGNEHKFNDNRSKYDWGHGNDNIRNNSRDDMYKDPAEEAGRSVMTTMTTTDMLVFTNLPPSVTLQALKAKMMEVGDLKFAEITSQGRAIVRFTNVDDAARCVQLFDHSKVDGQTIDVNFF